MPGAMNPQEAIELFRAAMTDPVFTNGLRKAGITVSTGLTWFDLRPYAQGQYPKYTPIRNTIPRKPGRGGPAVNWKVLRAINTGNVPPGVSEGNRNAYIDVSVLPFVRSYAGLGMEDFATFEAQYAAMNFDDARAISAKVGVDALMIAEEKLILGGNASLALGTTPTPTLAAVTGQGGTIGTGITVSVICVALTMAGAGYASLANGIKQVIARTNADGSTDNVNGGTAAPSAEATQATSANASSIQASLPTAVPGAVAYAWFVGNGAGNEKIYAITNINSVLIQSIPSTGQASSSLTATDNSKDGLVYDGLITFAADTSTNGGYFKQLANGTPGTGTTLTSDGGTGIKELNDMFSFFWDPFLLDVDEIWVHAQEQKTITDIVTANGGTPLLRLTTDAKGNGDISGGIRVTQVKNGITGKMVPINVHPYLPAGTIVARVKELPPGTYPGYNPGTTLEMDTRQDFYQIEWPLTSRKWPFGVYVDEVLVPWAPFAFGVITNVAKG